MKIHDISLSLNSDTQFYPGETEFSVSLVYQIIKGDGGNSSKLVMSSHAGTHVDTGKHVFNDGEPVDQIDLEKLMGDAVLIDFSDSEVNTIQKGRLNDLDIKNKIVIIKVIDDDMIRKGKLNLHELVNVPEDFSKFLVSKQIKAVAIDSLSYGTTKSHQIMLAEKIPIIEGLNLKGIKEGNYQFICLPLKITGLDGAPARAILMTN